jgi:hypothetical protein
MLYKIPMPTRTNGVKLFTLPNQQIGVEYQRGEPQVGAMAYDSARSLSRDVSFGSGTPEGSGGVSDEIIDKLLEFLEDNLPPQMMEAVQTILGGGDVTEKYDTGSGEFAHSGAMDAAIAEMGKTTEAATIRRLHGIREAQDRVRRWLPDIDRRAPQTSAAGVYRLALDALGVDAKGMHPDALWPVLKAQPRPGAERYGRPSPPPRMAADAADEEDFLRMFPDANRLLQR